MDIFSFKLKPFKNLFYTVLSINALLTVATFTAGANVFSIVLLSEDSLKQTRVLLLIVVAAAIFQTAYQKRLLKKLDGLSDFEEKMSHYLKMYCLSMIDHYLTYCTDIRLNRYVKVQLAIAN